MRSEVVWQSDESNSPQSPLRLGSSHDFDIVLFGCLYIMIVLRRFHHLEVKRRLEQLKGCFHICRSVGIPKKHW
jgi:hypothetical protein